MRSLICRIAIVTYVMAIASLINQAGLWKFRKIFMHFEIIFFVHPKKHQWGFYQEKKNVVKGGVLTVASRKDGEYVRSIMPQMFW